MVYGGSPLQDAGPSTTLLVRTMRSWAVSSFKPRILLAPWHSYNPMQGYEALWAEWHCQSEYCGARHDVQSRAGWPVRGYQSSPRPSNPSASIARPAGEPCYALLCPAMPCKCKNFVWKEARTCERARPSKLIKSSFTHELLRRCAHCTNAFTALSKESELGTSFSKQENVEQQGLQLDWKLRKKALVIADQVVHTQLQVW